MRVKKIKFISPLISGKTYKIVKNYSHTLVINDNEEINLASNVGPRENQEDTVALGTNHGYILLLVADGMGGKINGNEASYMVAKKIQRWFNVLTQEKLEQLDEKTLKRQLMREINEIKDNDFPIHGGTTLNMSIIGPEKTYIINVGDSRTYSIKDNEITLRTQDDSYAFERFNPVTKEERDNLRFYSLNNIITNCIEMKSLQKLNISSIKNTEYDILCHVTDGISDILKEDEMKEYIQKEKPAETLVEKTITREKEYSNSKEENFADYIEKHDNATAVVYTKKRTKNN